MMQEKHGFRLRWRAKLAPYPAPIRAAGFTLIELSIVLVIIGLIVGGVLVGQDLIKAAELRAQVTQNEQIESALVTFRLKYNCLAGDCKNATDFFGASNTSNGDGNRVICRIGYNGLDACSVAHTNNAYQYVSSALFEPSFTFDHLALAGLINLEPYDETSAAAQVPGVGFPKMKYQGTGTQVSASFGGIGGVTIYHLKAYQHITEGHKLMMGACGTGGGSIMSFHCGMKGAEALPLDTKIDDGLPLTGRVRIAGMVYTYRVPGDTNNEVGNSCTSASDLTNQYNLNNVYKDNRRCVLAVDMPF